MIEHAPTQPLRLPMTRPQPAAPLILVIDDSLTVRKIVEVTLQRADFAVLSFADGLTALRWLASAEATHPALVLLDIELPGMDGYEVARYLRTLPRGVLTRLVMLSRRDGVVDRLKSRLVGAQEHLCKPFKVADLLAVVQATLGLPTSPVKGGQR